MSSGDLLHGDSRTAVETRCSLAACRAKQCHRCRSADRLAVIWERAFWASAGVKR